MPHSPFNQEPRNSQIAATLSKHPDYCSKKKLNHAPVLGTRKFTAKREARKHLSKKG